MILPETVKELTPNEAAAYMNDNPGLIVIDARESWELKKEGSLPGAVQIDYLGPKFHEDLAKLERTKTCLIYCAIGGRSRLTAAEMVKLGFTKLAYLKGGLNAWVTTGHAVEKR